MKIQDLITKIVSISRPDTFDYPTKIKLVTHAGRFHSDEVTATAILELFLDQYSIDYEVIRDSFPVKSGYTDESPDTIVYDIGLGMYDHHQHGIDAMHCRRLDIDGKIGKYAAVGLIWKEIGPFMFPSLWSEIYDLYIRDIDDHDNGEKGNQYSRMIALFNPQPGIDKYTEDKVFFEVVKAVKAIFNQVFKSYNDLDQQYGVIELALSFNDEDYIMTDDFLFTAKEYPAARSWCRNHDIPFYIYPSSRTGYCFETISIVPGDMKNHLRDIPKEVREWEGVNFLHPTCFLGAADTKERAIEVVETICREF